MTVRHEYLDDNKHWVGFILHSNVPKRSKPNWYAWIHFWMRSYGMLDFKAGIVWYLCLPTSWESIWMPTYELANSYFCYSSKRAVALEISWSSSDMIANDMPSWMNTVRWPRNSCFSSLNPSNHQSMVAWTEGWWWLGYWPCLGTF